MVLEIEKREHLILHQVKEIVVVLEILHLLKSLEVEVEVPVDLVLLDLILPKVARAVLVFNFHH